MTEQFSKNTHFLNTIDGRISLSEAKNKYNSVFPNEHLFANFS